jgi:glycerate-2-kinase
MDYFKNYKNLTDHGETSTRKVALDCLARALFAADTYEGTKRIVKIDRKSCTLAVGKSSFNLSEIGEIYVVGAGKGSFPIACALDEILGDLISEGIVMIKDYEQTHSLKNIRLMKSGHPVPDANSAAGGREVERIAAKLEKYDIVFACMTGGCSALLEIPVDGVTLEDIISLNKLLLRTGALIGEMNAVRKHTSKIKGGGLIKILQPATVITLTQDTAPDSLPWPDPSLPDPSTFQDAVDMLKNYDIWDTCPVNVRNHLLKGLDDSKLETPKNFNGLTTYMFDTGNQRSACVAAAEYATGLGYDGIVLSTKIEGESKDVGTALAGIAKEIRLYGRPFKAPCVLVSAGETTVSIAGSSGEGGPNQELAVGFARSIQGYEKIAIAAIDSEGTDGPTDIAGGISDGKTIARAKELQVDLFDALKRHDISPALRKLDDAILTGPTGTNVVNLRVLVIE